MSRHIPLTIQNSSEHKFSKEIYTDKRSVSKKNAESTSWEIFDIGWDKSSSQQQIFQ